MKKIMFLAMLSLVCYSCGIKQTSGNLSVEDSIRVSEYVDSINNLKKQKWVVNYYLNEFGEKSENKFLTTSNPLSGTFSNSATENSSLLASININSETNIDIMLFEYSSNNPVKAGIEKGYNIRVKGSNGEVNQFYAKIDDDRINMNANDSKKLCSIFKANSDVMFFIEEITDYTPSKYRFKTDEYSGFEEAMKLFIK